MFGLSFISNVFDYASLYVLIAPLTRPGFPAKLGDALTQKKKEEVRLHYSISGNYSEGARAFDINESTVRGTIDVRSLPNKMKLSIKCNFAGAGTPLIYSIELDNELLKWIFVLRDLNFPVLSMSPQERAKLVI